MIIWNRKTKKKNCRQLSFNLFRPHSALTADREKMVLMRLDADVEVRGQTRMNTCGCGRSRWPSKPDLRLLSRNLVYFGSIPNTMTNSQAGLGGVGVGLRGTFTEFRHSGGFKKKKKSSSVFRTSIAGSISVPAATSSWAAVMHQRLNC